MRSFIGGSAVAGEVVSGEMVSFAVEFEDDLGLYNLTG